MPHRTAQCCTLIVWNWNRTTVQSVRDFAASRLHDGLRCIFCQCQVPSPGVTIAIAVEHSDKLGNSSNSGSSSSSGDGSSGGSDVRLAAAGMPRGRDYGGGPAWHQDILGGHINRMSRSVRLRLNDDSLVIGDRTAVAVGCLWRPWFYLPR